MNGKSTKHLVAAAAMAVAGLAAGSAPVFAQGTPSGRLEQMLDRFARQLSAVLAERQSRTFVVERIEASKTRVVALGELLSTALAASGTEGAPGLARLAAQVGRLESALERAGAPIPRLDLKLPVREHQALLASSETIYVLAAPLADESEVESLTAYANLEPVTLDPDEPPKIPTLVVIPAESESLEPTYPLRFSAEPGDEEDPRRVDDFVGIPKIWIADESEGWTSGDPEIYVITFRTQGGASFTTRRNLPGVNDIRVWYDLGDPNSTYLYYDSSYSSVISIIVYEEDNFAHGADDFMGSVTFDWTALPPSSYTTFSNGDMRIQVDLD